MRALFWAGVVAVNVALSAYHADRERWVLVGINIISATLAGVLVGLAVAS